MGRCKHLGVLVRYADDFVVMCKTESQAKEALQASCDHLGPAGPELHPEKTRWWTWRRGKEGFDFLGCTRAKATSIQRRPRRHFMQRWPSPKAMKNIRQRVHELTDVRGNGREERQGNHRQLNPVLRGWGNYFRTGNSEPGIQPVGQLRMAAVSHAG